MGGRHVRRRRAPARLSGGRVHSGPWSAGIPAPVQPVRPRRAARHPAQVGWPPDPDRGRHCALLVGRKRPSASSAVVVGGGAWRVRGPVRAMWPPSQCGCPPRAAATSCCCCGAAWPSRRAWRGPARRCGSAATARPSAAIPRSTGEPPIGGSSDPDALRPVQWSDTYDAPLKRERAAY